MNKKMYFIFVVGLSLLLSPLATGKAVSGAEKAKFLEEMGIHIPKDLDECFVQLDEMLKAKDIKELKNFKEEELAKYHFGLGMWIRNEWMLWGGSQLSQWFNDRGISHPDDMSSIIITSYWRHLNNRPIQLAEQINMYRGFWEKQGVKLPHKVIVDSDGLFSNEEIEVYRQYFSDIKLETTDTVVGLNLMVTKNKLNPGKFLIVFDENVGMSSEGKKEQDEADLNSTREYILKESETVSKEALADYLEKNKMTKQLATAPDFGEEAVVLTEKAKRKLFSGNNGWELFYKKYPDAKGIFSISHVGFSKDKKQAVFYVGHQYLDMAGIGQVIIYENVNGKWQKKDQVMVWVS